MLSGPGLAWAESQAPSVDIQEIKRGHEQAVVVLNKDPYAPAHFSVQFSSSRNVRASVALPLRGVLKPGERREIFSVRPADASQGYAYQLSLQPGFGDPGAVPKDQVFYVLPWEHGQKHLVTQGYFGTFTHQGLRALDFDLALGTKVCAARDGVVVSLRQDQSQGGPSPAFAQLANYVNILHDDGTWANYAHFEQGGVLVKLGQRVRAGQVIGLSGATGQVNGPHLHFCVQKASWGPEPESVATRFWVSEEASAALSQGTTYYSWHPGGPAFARHSAAELDEAALAKQTKPALSGKLSFRQERLDNKDLIYCVNGTPQAREVSVSLTEALNVQASQPLPYTKVVPAHTEMFLLSVTLQMGKASYQCAFQSKVFKPGQP
jgi:murein DD-endopeptidase MepM/ murein hydrolase activator NlpD